MLRLAQLNREEVTMSNSRESGWYWVNEFTEEIGVDSWEPRYYDCNYSESSGAWLTPEGWLLDDYVTFKIDECKIIRGSHVQKES